ncbi:hypothetical protein M433DRAFT_10620, partial [Acidomyces richmondensis BFW]
TSIVYGREEEVDETKISDQLRGVISYPVDYVIASDSHILDLLLLNSSPPERIELRQANTVFNTEI